MRKNRERFGKFIRDKRVHDPRELRQSDVAEILGISTSLYGLIETNARPPFDLEKMEIFANLFHLTYEEKTMMYDLAARETNEIPADLEDIIMYSEVGDVARQLFRELQNGDFVEEKWKTLIREAEKEKKRREGGDE